MKEITALVPMKGASERVIGKNLKPFLDKPLCTYILETLEKSKYIQRIIVNTDSEQIMEIVQAFPKVVIHRRVQELQGHHIPMNSIIQWDIEHDTKQSVHYLQTHTTNPLLTYSTIDKSIESYFNSLATYDSLFSVTLFQSRLYDSYGKGVNHNPKQLLNTQDLPKLYEENSNIYLFSRESFLKSQANRIGVKAQMFEMNKLEAIDIDTEDDFQIAQAVYKTLRK